MLRSAFDTAVARLEAILARDVGSRGIAAITLPGQLAAAAAAFVDARAVVVLTGFPCRLADTPPTETDGPPGAMALAAAAIKLGKPAAIATDTSSAGVLHRCAAAWDLVGRGDFALYSFPPRADWATADDHQLAAVAAAYDHAVAIERAGRAADGGYYTMRALSMNHLVAPIDELLTVDCACGRSDAGGDAAGSTGGGASPAPATGGPAVFKPGWRRSVTSLPTAASPLRSFSISASPVPGVSPDPGEGSTERDGASATAATSAAVTATDRTMERASSLTSLHSIEVGYTASPMVAVVSGAAAASATASSGAGGAAEPVFALGAPPSPTARRRMFSAASALSGGLDFDAEGWSHRGSVCSVPAAPPGADAAASRKGSSASGGGNGGPDPRSAGAAAAHSSPAGRPALAMSPPHSAGHRGGLTSGASSAAVTPRPPILRTSTGIGDGGNECGMGKVHAAVVAHIPRGATIACAIPADNLITAGVSNWGGWGLAAAVEALLRCPGPTAAAAAGSSSDDIRAAAGAAVAAAPVGFLLPTAAEERAMAEAMIAAGARDGITGALDGSVDGAPLEVHLAVLQEMRAVLSDVFASGA